MDRPAFFTVRPVLSYFSLLYPGCTDSHRVQYLLPCNQQPAINTTG